MKLFFYEADENTLASEWAVELRRILSKAGLGAVDIAPVDEELAVAFNQWDGKTDINSLVYHYVDDHNLDYIPLVLVTSNEGSKYHAYSKQEVGVADWGCWLAGPISVAYSTPSASLATQLHETLHLFNVDDCYDKDNQCLPKAQCADENCVMRYGKVSNQVCSSVLAQLRALSSNT